MPYEVDAERINNRFRKHDNKVYEQRLVMRLVLADVEDPEIYAAQPILDWQQSEHGKWILEHSLDPTYRITADYASYGYLINITAHITPKRWTEYCLRFNKYVF